MHLLQPSAASDSLTSGAKSCERILVASYGNMNFVARSMQGPLTSFRKVRPTFYVNMIAAPCVNGRGEKPAEGGANGSLFTGS